MIDGIPNQPLYYYQKDIIGFHRVYKNIDLHCQASTSKYWQFPGIEPTIYGDFARDNGD